MTDYGQKAANWGQLLEDGAKVIVSVKNYDSLQEPRLLIPFIARLNNKGQVNKMGFLNTDGEIVVEPLYDIILDDCFNDTDIIRVGSLFPYAYSYQNGKVSPYVRYKYRAVTSSGEFITDMEYDDIVISKDNDVITVHDREKGYAVFDRQGNEVVPFGRYSWIDGFEHGLARVKGGNNEDNRWGIINTNGTVLLPIEYSNIWNFYGKNRFSTKVIKNGIETDVFFHNLNPNLPRHGKYRILRENTPYDDSVNGYGSHFGEYAGSYAQDIMGYSDDVINDAFEGDPDAYWNID